MNRVKRLENDSEKGEGNRVHFIFVEEGETTEHANERYLSENPQAREDDLYYFFSW
jgi:hypothetical protein